MFQCGVNNHIDYFNYFNTDNGLIAVVWCIAQLTGPCRSGRADIYNISHLVKVTPMRIR